ncbi:endonuclease/exonuclease/phosphatase family protein [Cesiribacter sp. SM1]|uniref:endonuclease/exonuclease/phosphatase family protein n=1 Tax=Cesiribacter sp. SM1 TaxID=2861196 RepID=UPI001CD7A87A|nr:endonuclease/exonuclease/phosphatase family protein [Cesiribacter sp. SM1]
MKQLNRHISKALSTSPWLAGPFLALAAYCPLFIFALAGSWLPHLLVISLLWCGWLLLKHKSWKAGWLALWILLCIPVLIPQHHTSTPMQGNGSTLRLAQVNVLQENRKHELVAQQIMSLDADVLAFQEVNKVWTDTLAELLSEEYPYYSLAPHEKHYGMAIFSRKPLKDVQLNVWAGYPVLSAKIRQGDQETLVLSVHTPSPVTLKRFKARNEELHEIAKFVREADMPTLILGDFNIVPWDSALKPLLQAAGLKDCRSLHYTATWPSPLGRWGIPIDYVLHSAHWQRISHGSAPIPGSDHKAMVATLALKPVTNKENNSILLGENLEKQAE